MNSDNARGFPVLQGGHSRVRDCQPRLFYGEAVEPPCGDAVHRSMEEGQDEGVVEVIPH